MKTATPIKRLKLEQEAFKELRSQERQQETFKKKLKFEAPQKQTQELSETQCELLKGTQHKKENMNLEAEAEAEKL